MGNHLALFESVFGGIAVDENGGCAFTFGCERFESAIAVGIRVAHQHDLALDVDALLTEKFVVLGIAAVCIDQRCRHFSGSGHAAPRRAYALVLHVRIAGDRHLSQAGSVMHGRDHFQKSELWIAAVDIVAADDDLL